MDYKKFMLLALDKARAAGSTRGACVIKKGKLVSCETNHVHRLNDPSAHAEVEAIRSACKKFRSTHLDGCVVVCTTEPCPMCLMACYYSRVKKIVWGARSSDAMRWGRNEIAKNRHVIGEISKITKIELKQDFMRKECIALLKECGP
ncbi:MAG: nucleoside deaminase [Candidatus Micrarchaeales archaeon]|nr:nucleoside deaminase [Candidatus Micrarchaeales archaeon]